MRETRKIRIGGKENITVLFFEVLLMIKLFHWKTREYSEHKATDEYYENLNKNMDRFMEVYLGKDTSVRMNFKSKATIPLHDVNKKELIRRLIAFKTYLLNFSPKGLEQKMINPDLYTIRDEILADTNQLLYLLSLS